MRTALYQALESGQIAARARLFRPRAGDPPHHFAALDNVLLAPHSIAWTDELFRDIGRTACQSMVDLSLGRRPKGVVNPAVFERRRLSKQMAKALWPSQAHGRRSPLRGRLEARFLILGSKGAAMNQGRLAGPGGLDQRCNLGHRRGHGPAVAQEGAGWRSPHATSRLGQKIAGGDHGRRRRSAGHRLRRRQRSRGAVVSLDQTAQAFGGLHIVVNNAGMVAVQAVRPVQRGGLGPGDGGECEIDLFFDQACPPLLPPAAWRLHRQCRLGQQFCRPGVDAGLHDVETCGAGLNPLDRPGLCRRRGPLQLRLSRDHRYADASRASRFDSDPAATLAGRFRPRGDGGGAFAGRRCPLHFVFYCEDSSA